MRKNLLALAVVAGFAATATAAPVTTEGVGQGRHGDVKVAVTFDNNKIQDIKVLSSEENKVLTKHVFGDMREAMIKHNTADIDSVSGATMSSNALRQAVKAAAKKAGIVLAGPVFIAKNKPTIPEKSTYDVVVVGAGGAGFSAAITAADEGAKVVILEKMPQVGGNSLISGAEMAASGNWLQKKEGIKDSVEQHYQDTMKGGDNKGDPAVVRTLCENALDAAKWARDTVKVEFEDHMFHFGGHSVKRSLIPKGATGAEFIQKFLAACKDRHIPIITNMRAESLITDKAGRVVGVKAVMDGKPYTFMANKGVVLATGGFSANVEMRTKANEFYGKAFKTTNFPGATGDGIKMAEAVGGAAVNMGLIQTYPMCDPNSGAIELIDDARFCGAVLVNQEGKRFTEELGRRDVMSKAILNQTGQYCYAIFNPAVEARAHALANHQDEVNVFGKTGILYKGDTLKDIADHFKIPYDNLKATMERVNHFAKTGKDTDFNYRGKFSDMSTGPYWIYRGVPSVHHTMGGIRINPMAQVLNKDGKAIQGLYAAGEITGTTHGTNRLGSNAYADIIVFGRIAGKNAAK